MKAYQTRDALREALIRVFSAQPEIHRINLFGREAEGKADRYSDIDMLVYSSDPARTRDQLGVAFSSIAQPLERFHFGGGPDWYGEMVLLAGWSPYQKVDFSIGCGLDLSKTRVSIVYDCPERAIPARSQLGPFYIQNEPAYRLNEILFSIPRFTKCLFRVDFDLYRRWNGAVNAALLAMYEKHFGAPAGARKDKMAAYEYKALYESLAPPEKDRLARIWPLNAQMDVALSFQEAVRLFVDLMREKAARAGAPLNEPFIQLMLSFLSEEIRRFRKP